MTVSLLSNQLNYIFMSMDDSQRKTIDYSVLKYFELVLKLKAWFEKTSFVGNDEFYQKILRANYKCKDFQDRLYFNDNEFVSLSLASSGQQEAVWILNILNYFSAVNKKIFLIVEEPESHLYPESQMHMTDAISAFINGGGNSGLITTHSPYILGELNNLILSEKTFEKTKNDVAVNKIISKNTWIKRDKFQAFHVDNREIQNAIREKSGFIKDELIDGASSEINRRGDELIRLSHGKDEDE